MLCHNGHDNASDQRYCGACGVPVIAAVATLVGDAANGVNASLSTTPSAAARTWGEVPADSTTPQLATELPLMVAPTDAPPPPPGFAGGSYLVPPPVPAPEAKKKTARNIAIVGVAAVILCAAGVAVGASSGKSAQGIMTTSQLETQLEGGGWTTPDGNLPATATAASCIATPSVNSRGVGQYVCQITFDTGGTVARTVTVDSTGGWATSGS
jgi:hypothetical protein